MNIIEIRKSITALNHTLCVTTNYVISECSCVNCKTIKTNIRKELKKAVNA